MKMRTMIISFCAAVSMLSGCSRVEPVKTEPERASAIIRDGAARKYARKPPYNLTNPVETPSDLDKLSENAEQRAEQIATHILREDSVKNTIENVSIVVSGKSAIIGLHTAKELSPDDLTQIRRKIERQVRVADSAVKNISVTATDDLVQRLARIADFSTGTE